MNCLIDFKKIILTLLVGTAMAAAFAAEPDCEAYRRGVKEYDSWQYGDALNSFLESDRLVPYNGYNYFYLANIMFMADQKQNAFDFATQALAYFKSDDLIGLSDTYQFLAFLAYFFGYEIEGITTNDTAKLYDKAVKVAPNYWKAYVERGNYYNISCNEYSLSDADYIKAIELNPKEVEPYSRLIWSCEERNMYEEAEKYCRMCIAADLDYPHHHDKLAKLLLKKGDNEEARDVLWQAFIKSNGYYYQGMDTVAEFPEEFRQWFFEQMRQQAEIHPDQPQWNEYLESLPL